MNKVFPAVGLFCAFVIILAERTPAQNAGSGGAAGFLVYTAACNPACIRALDSKPLVLVPAVAEKRIVPIEISTRYVFGTQAYQGINVSNRLYVSYGGNPAITLASGDYNAVPSQVISQATESMESDSGITGAAVFAPGNSTGKDLTLALSTGTFRTGALKSATVTAEKRGSGYAAGDTGTVGGGAGRYTVLTVDSGGGVLTVNVSGGSGYVAAAPIGTAVATGRGDGVLALDVGDISPLGDGSISITTRYVLQ